MHARRWKLAMALLAGSAGCDPSGQWRERLDEAPLFQETRAAARSDSCSRLVPPEYGRTLPVPAIERGKGVFLIAFYPPMDRLKDPKVTPPEFAAVFPPGKGRDALCRVLAGRKEEALGPAVPPGASPEAYFKSQAAYYTLLEGLAPAYFQGRPASEPERKLARELAAAFRGAAEPGLHPAYYRMSPGFWEWLRTEAGDSIPKP